MKIKVGIFFGGPSREREISFAGGRTVYDNLDKSIFEPVPIFVDSNRNLILLDWPFIYKGTIRDFYPPIAGLPESPNNFQVYVESLGMLPKEELNLLIDQVGTPVQKEELPQLINMAFLALHGVYGEDGAIQAELESLQIPYTGSGVQASQIGMDKALQKDLMREKAFPAPEVIVLDRMSWIEGNHEESFNYAKDTIKFPMVIRPANQGSSIGVSIIQEPAGFEGFEQAVNAAFFRNALAVPNWNQMEEEEKVEYIRDLSDIRSGLGFPLDVTIGDQTKTIYHPEELLLHFNKEANQIEQLDGAFILEAHQDEKRVIVEEFIHGKEFSCIVIRKEDGAAVALPPTEIIKGNEVFDYRSKYLPGLSRKVTPIDLGIKDINAIRTDCERLFRDLGFQTYARIDGFIQEDGTIYLNDPNTTSGMLPSSFFFHQAAEIGLNPSQFLTYIIRISLQERIAEKPDLASYDALLKALDESILGLKSNEQEKKRVAVFLGGYSFERHISVESGRNIFEKLASSDQYEPLPIFVSGNENGYSLTQIPINLLLKDNADDIRDKILHYQKHPIIEEIKMLCSDVTQKYASKDVVFEPHAVSFEQLKSMVDAVFIALHGRPGEDGQIQKELEQIALPYNGSNPDSSSITINKYETLQTLKQHGFKVTEQLLMSRSAYEASQEDFYLKIESRFSYPFIAKPVDDGCSSAVKVIKDRKQLEAFTRLMFRPLGQEGEEARRILSLMPKEEFPRKQEILFEALIQSNGANHFLEITGGLLTHYTTDGTIRYEVFEPSEALSGGEVLSLEEKFLAGEGQNITPARFAPNKQDYEKIAAQVKADLERAARILNVQGYARIDAFVRIKEDQEVETIIIEVNSLPGMTPATCIFHQAAINDYKPYEFIDKIIKFGFKEEEEPTQAIIPPVVVDEIEHEEPALEEADDIIEEEPEGHVEEEIVVEPEEQPEIPEEVTVNSTENIPQEEASTLTPIQESPTIPEPKVAEAKDETLMERLRRQAREFALQVGRTIWSFLKSPAFLKNIGAMVVFLLACYWIIIWGLNIYTHHGESLEVHKYVRMTLDDAREKARSGSFELVVLDSPFIVGTPPNVILEQDPPAFSRVKEHRRIYVVISGSTPTNIDIPTFKELNYDYNRYKNRLEIDNVFSTVQDRQFDPKQAENTILFFYHNGKKVTENMVDDGYKVPEGDTLAFVITERNTGMVEVPDLICTQYKEAYFLITSSNLTVGNVDQGTAFNQDDGYIYRQEPAPGQMVPIETRINVFLTEDSPVGCPD